MKDAVLVLKDLHKTYDNEVHALRGVDLEFRKGEFTVIIGPSGAGKSTLIRSINRLIDPNEGEIIFDGIHMESIRGKALRRQRADMGMIFQHYNLIGRVNVIKNVLHGRLGKMSGWKSLFNLYSHEDKLRALKLLRKVGLEEKKYQRADALSGGQMQRVGICRAIVQEPKLLLADEPIASLDPKSATTVMQSIKDITEESHLSCIVNLHQVDFAKKFATRIIGLKDGKVVFDGAPYELTDEITASIYEGKEDQIHLKSSTVEDHDLSNLEQDEEEVAGYV